MGITHHASCILYLPLLLFTGLRWLKDLHVKIVMLLIQSDVSKSLSLV